MAKKEGLTKVDIDKKLKGILRRKKITKENFESLSNKERERLGELTTEILNKLNGSKEFDEEGRNKFDLFIEKVWPMFTQDTKNSFWESNHQRITWAISSSMKETGHLPTVQDISDKSHLSRQTIYKHLKDFQSHPLYQEQILKMRMLASDVLSKVYQSAIQGDIGASKLFLNACGMLNNQSIKHQQNYIQINGLTLTQDAIQMLSPDQLLTIENVLKQVTQPQAITQGNTIHNQ